MKAGEELLVTHPVGCGITESHLLSDSLLRNVPGLETWERRHYGCVYDLNVG